MDDDDDEIFIRTISQIEKFKHGIVLRDSYNAVFILYSDMKDLKQYIYNHDYMVLGQTFITSPLHDGILFTNLYNNRSVYLTPCQIKELIN